MSSSLGWSKYVNVNVNVSAPEGNAIRADGTYSTNPTNLSRVGGSQQSQPARSDDRAARQSSTGQLDPETAAQLDPLHDLMAMVADDHRADDVTIDLTNDAVDGVLDAVREDVAFGRATTTVDREVASALLFAGLLFGGVSPEARSQALGQDATAICIILFASPLSTIATVLSKRDASSIVASKGSKRRDILHVRCREKAH